MILRKPTKIASTIAKLPLSNNFKFISNRLIHTPKSFPKLNSTLNPPQNHYSPPILTPLHSKKSLEFLLNQNYKHLSINFNKRVKDSKLESLSLLEVIQLTSKVDNFSLLYNISSELLSLEWYLNYLTNDPQSTDTLTKMGLNSNLLDTLKVQFGGLDAFSNQIVERQKLLNGKGWIWLIMYKDSYLKLISSPNHEFPLYPPIKQKSSSTIPSPASSSSELNSIQLLFPIPTWEYFYILDYKFAYSAYLQNLINNLNWKELDKLIK